MAKKITPGEHNMQMAKSAVKGLLGPVISAGASAASAGLYDIMNRSDNQASSAMVEKATNDKGVKDNYGLPREEWRNKSVNPQESLKVELKAREKGYVPPSERNKPPTKQDVRPRGRVTETGKSSVTPAQEREMIFKALKKSDGPQEVDPVKSRMDLKK